MRTEFFTNTGDAGYAAGAEAGPDYAQRRALKELDRIRAAGEKKALVVACAGSGKTLLAAFDARNSGAERLLYIVHEGSEPAKAPEVFRKVFGSGRSYGVFDGAPGKPDADFVFSADVTAAGSPELFGRHAWDYIVVDGCRREAAETYRKILRCFEPKFLLGITAGPERADREGVFSLFGRKVPYGLRLRDEIISGLAAPFRYYGIGDERIESGTEAAGGRRFMERFPDEKHCGFIHNAIEAHRQPGRKLKALAFCRDDSHAARMAQAMEEYYPGGTRCLAGKNSAGEWAGACRDLQDDSGDLRILFTADLPDEGADIPGADMLLFLRPAESRAAFIRRLGRGLRACEGKEFVTVLDFIGNGGRRSVQAAFALGSLSGHCVTEKQLVKALVSDDFRSLGLAEYGVEIRLDGLSKKEILRHTDHVNFHTKRHMKQDYLDFKKHTGAARYPRHMDYLNSDGAPDLIQFMQAGFGDRKNASYYGFLKAVGEPGLPVFSVRQERFIRYASEMLPLVRPYEYLIIRYLLDRPAAWKAELIQYLKENIPCYRHEAWQHAARYMLRTGFFGTAVDKFGLIDLPMDGVFEAYMRDLLEYGLGRYDTDFDGAGPDEAFRLWAAYTGSQVRQLLLGNPNDTVKENGIDGGTACLYVTAARGSGIREPLKYAGGYTDPNTFRWETAAKIGEKELYGLKQSRAVRVFVRKAGREDGIPLPFTYIGTGRMEYMEGSRKANGAHLFRIAMDAAAPRDVYFDFRLPESE